MIAHERTFSTPKYTVDERESTQEIGEIWRRIFLKRCLPNRSGLPSVVRRFGVWRSLVSALHWGCKGRGFESRHPDHFPIDGIDRDKLNEVCE